MEQIFGDIDGFSDAFENDSPFDDTVDWDFLKKECQKHQDKLADLYDMSDDVDLTGQKNKEPNFRPKNWRPDMVIPMFKIGENDVYYLDCESQIFRNWDNPEDTVELEKGLDEVYCEERTRKLNKHRDAFHSRKDSGKERDYSQEKMSEKEFWEDQAREYFDKERFA